jgi:hypothetical protein
MAEEYGLANLLAGQSLPASDSGLGQLYGGGDSYTAEPQAPSSAPAILPGYRPVALPNGGYVYAYKDHTDEQAIAAFEGRQGAEQPQHKPIPHGHVAAREPVSPEFKQAQREPRYEAFDPISEVLNAENQLDRASIEEIPRAYKYALTPTQAAQVKRQEEEAALAAQPRDPERQGFIPAVGAGFAREIGSVGRFASESAQPFAPGVAQTIKEVTQPAEAKAKELHQPISDIEIAEAKQKGFVPYAGAQLTRAGDILGGFAGEWGVPGIVSKAGAPGRAISGGLTFAQLYGDLSRRAEESGVELSLPEKYAGAAISTAIFQLAPNFVTKGLPLNVLAPSAKAIVDIYEKEGAEAAQKAVGSLAGNIVKSYGSGVVGGTAAMAGTEAVTRHMLGQPQITPEETLEMAKDAAIISAPMSILHGRAATAEAQKGYREGAARAYREDQRLQQQVDAINQENAERTWPEMRTEGQRADQAQGAEQIVSPGLTPAEPAPPTGEINLTQPVDWVPTQDGFPNTVEGLKSFIAHHKDKMQNEVVRRNPEVEAPIEAALVEANQRLRALRGTAQKKAPPEPTGIPPSAETLPWPVAPEAQTVTPEAPPPVEAVTPEAPPPVEAITPEAPVEPPAPPVEEPPAPAVSAAPWPVEALGLKPNAALTKRLAKLDMNNPEHIDAISDELNKTRVQIEPEKLAALSNHFDAIKPKEAPSAEQIPETGAPDGGSSAQPIFREEGGDQTIGGKGVEPSGQGEQVAEVEAPKEEVAAPEGAIAWKKAFEAQRKSKQQEEDEALIRQIERNEYAQRGEDGEPEELFFSKKADEQEKPWWYSAVGHAIDNAPENKRPGQSWKAWLKNQPNVKADELEHSGVNDFLDLIGTTPIGKGEIKQHLDRFGVTLGERQFGGVGKPDMARAAELEAELEQLATDQTHWERQVRKAQESVDKFRAENPRDILPLELEMPLVNSRAEVHRLTRKISKKWEDYYTAKMGIGEPSQFNEYAQPNGADYVELVLTLPKNEGEYFHSHWLDVKNPVAHIRGATHADTRRTKTFFVDEVQSDWGQMARKGAIEGTPAGAERVTRAEELQEASTIARDTMEEYRRLYNEEKDKQNPDYEYLARLGAKLERAEDAHNAAYNELSDFLIDKPIVPNAPFIGETKSWVNLALKKAIQHAIATGHDRVAFTTGDQAADHYEPFYSDPEKAAEMRKGMRKFYDEMLPAALKGTLRKLGGGEIIPVKIDFTGEGVPVEQVGFDITPELRASFERGVPLFAKKEAKGELHTPESLQEELTKLYGKEVPQVEVSTREKEGVDEKTQGFFDPKNQRAVLIADNIAKGEDIHGLMRHEVATHLKKLGATDGEFQGFLRQVEALRDKGAKDIVEAFERVPKGTKEANVTHEALAYLVQNKPSLPIVKRFMSWVRRNAYKITGSAKWLKGDDFAVMADEVLRTKIERPMTEGERMETRAPEGEEERARPPLTKIDRTSTLKTIAKTLKRAALAVSDPSAMSEEYAKFRRRVIAESAGLTKALEGEPTYDPDTGIRVDYLRNQYDSAYQLSLEGLFNGVPVLEPKTGVVRIQPTTRTNLDRIMADAAKLPLKVSYDGQKKEPLEVMADIFRIKMGEQELKEYEEAKVKLRAIEQLPEATRNQADTKAEMEKLKTLISNQERGIGRERNVTREDIRWANDEIQRVPGVQDILDRWGETNQELLRFARDTNWITPEKYEEWSERPSYIPMYKPMEDILAERDETPAFPGGGPKTVGKLFGKTGAASAFPVNVFESLSQHYTSMITNSMMNNVKYRAFQQLERVGLAERVTPTYKGKDAVKARAAGKDFLYKVKDEEAFRSLTMANMYSNPLLDLVAIPANVVRRTALFLNPAYYYRTMIHDPLAATLTTTAKGAIGPVTPADALYQIGKRAMGFDKSAKDLQYYGISGLANMDANMHRFARALGDSPKYNKWLQYIDKVHSSFDDATRTIVYEAAKKQAAKEGITDPQVINDIAAVKARDFADFAAKGSSQLVRIAGKQTPFLHAHFVGLDKMLRSATGHGKDSKEGKAQRDRFVAGATLAASAVVAITLANIRDKRYRDLPIGEWSKNIIAGFDDEGRAIKIPVPQEIGFWFKFVPELMTRMLMGVSDKPEASKAFHGMAVDTLLPPGLADPVSIAVRGWLQMQTNTELHSGLPIESPQEQLLLPEDRDKRATIFSKALRDQLKKYKLAEDFSPDKFDSFMRSYLTTIWDNSALAATMLHDAYTDKRGLFELPFNKDFTEVYPGAKAFFSNPRNISATPRFYDMAKPLYETLKSVNAAAHGEMDDSVERFDELRNDPVVMQRYRMAKVAATYRAKISALEKAIEQLDNRQDLTEAQRRKLYWDRIKDRNELARTAVEELSKGLMQDKKFKDDVEKSWKLSVSPEDLAREIGSFKENVGDTEE